MIHLLFSQNPEDANRSFFAFFVEWRATWLQRCRLCKAFSDSSLLCYRLLTPTVRVRFWRLCVNCDLRYWQQKLVNRLLRPRRSNVIFQYNKAFNFLLQEAWA